jgi:uncharacterized RDD family membrane protein YckC
VGLPFPGNPLAVLPAADPRTRANAKARARYAGLATRAVSFALDAVVINVVATIAAVGAALILSLLHVPKYLDTALEAIGAAAYVLGSIAYFTAFWSTTGQTPGARIMQIRVIPAKGGPLRPRRAVVRCIAVALGALPLFAGYVVVLFNSERRAFPDWVARTLVIEEPQLSVAETIRARRRMAYDAARRSPPAPGV